MNKQFTVGKLILVKLVRSMIELLKTFKLKGFASFYLLPSLFVLVISLFAFSFSKKHTSSFTASTAETSTLLAPPVACPSAPTNCTISFNGSCAGETDLNPGDTLCINSGTFDCEVKFKGGTVYVAPGATFEPEEPNKGNDLEGTIINCGTVILYDIKFKDFVNIQNYGTIEFKDAKQDDASTIYNHEGATITFTENFKIERGTDFTNDGVINASGNFEVRDGTFTNNNTLNFSGNFQVENNAALNNFGIMNVTGAITINSATSFYNACTMVASDEIIIETDMVNDGLLLTDGTPGLLTIQLGVTVTNNHEVVSNVIYNDGTILGDGNFWINGLTTQTSNGSIGTDGNGLNFHDLSPDQNGNGNSYFDEEQGTIDPSVTVNPPASPAAIPDATYIGPSCGVIVAIEDCTNGIDDDGDLLVDCDDPDCTFQTAINISSDFNGANISCFGANDGALEAVVTSGGITPFSYLWNTSDTTAAINTLIAGNYAVTVTDNNGCTSVESVSLLQPDSMILQMNATDIGCAGATDGLGEVVVLSGGTAPISFLWSNTETTATIGSLTAGNYVVTVTDLNGCIYIDSLSINEPAVLSAQLDSINVSCFGGADGSANVIANGGTAPYLYLWSNDSTTQTISNLLPGNYSVTVTDVNGCSVVNNIIVNEPPLTLLQVDSTDITCFGETNGTATVIVTGVNPPFSYLWSTNATTQNINNLSIGVYRITVTDSNGCTNVDSTSVGAIPPLSSTDIVTMTSCFGESDGAVDLTVTGGTAPFSFIWNNGATTEDINGISAGSYFVTTTDFNGCIALDTALVEDPLQIGASFMTENVACNGDSTGSIDMTVFNGTAPYSFLWSHGVTVEDPGSLPAGNYSVTITDDLACSIVLADTISEPTPITASPSVTDVSCYGGTDGFVIETNATGGTPGYHYNWSDFDAEAIWTFEGTTDDITGNNNHAQGVVGTVNYVTDTIERENAFLFDGATKIRYSVDNAFMESNYTQKSVSMWVKPTDFSGVQTLIEEDGNLYGFTIRLNETDLEIAVEKTFIFNFNREYDTPFPLDGAWHHIAYTWDDGDLRVYLDGVLVITDTFTIGDMFSTGGDGGLGGTFYQDAFNNFNDNFYRGRMDNVIYHNIPLSQQQIVDIIANDGTRTNLNADNYTVTITDANGCSINEIVTVDQPDPMTIISDSTNVSCAGASDGTISLTVSGGVAPYTYQWSNDSTTQVITNLISGGYTVTVTDLNGCSITDSTTVNDVPLLTLNHTATASSCFGGNDGTVNLVVTGGTAPYSYLWNQGATTEDILGVSAGVYEVTVTDTNGCTATESATVDNTSLILVTCNNVNASCYEGSDGSIDITITGGTAPYTFLWNNGATVEDLTNLAAGNYTVTVTDNLSCSVIHSDTITQPDSITIAVNLTNVSCFGGADGAVLEVNTTGGTPGYHYNWNDMEAEAIWTFENTADDISGNGHHPFAIDGNVLYVADTIERNTAFQFDGNTRIRYSNPPFMNTNFSVRTISMWLKDDDTSGEQILFEEGYTQNGFAVRFKDGNIEGSVASGNVRRSLSEPYPTDGDWHHVALVYDNGEMYLYLDGDLLNSRSTGFGTISYPFSVTGGIGGVYFSDAFGETDNDYYTGYMDDVRYHTVALTEDQIEDIYDRTGNRHNLTANTYNLTVTDENGCTNVLEIQVAQPTELVMTKDSTAVSCFGGSDGSLNIVVNGGVSPYSYLWNTGVTTSNLTGLPMGTYTVTVTDDNSCTLIDSILIEEPNEISLNAVVTDASCNGGNDGSIDLTVTDGQAPLSFQWNNGAGTDEDPTGLSAGNYIVTVTDNVGCTMTDTVLVAEPAGMSVSSVVSEISCNGGADGEIDVTITGGSSPYTFNWDNGAGTDEDPTGLAANTYQVTVTDNNSCTIIESITLIDPAPATITGTTTEVTCENGSDGTIDLSVSGGTPDYTHWWSDWDVEAFYPFEFHPDDTTGNGHYPTGFSQASIFFSNDAVNGDFSIAMDDYLIRLSEAGGFMETAFTTRTVMMWVKPDNLGGREILFEEGSDVHGMAIRLNNNILEAAVSRFSTVEFSGNHTFPNDGAWHHVAVVFDNGDLTLYLDGVAGATTSTGFANIQTNGGDGGIGGSIFGDVFDGPGNSFYHGLMDDLIYANEAFSPIQITEAFNNNGDRTGLSAGTYTVFVHDANGCITTQDFTITELPPLVLSFDSTDVNCNGFLDGTIDLTVTGGTTPYTYLWSAAGQTTQDLTALGAGTYTVTVTDANTCTSINAVTINEPPVLTATVDSTDVLCNGTNTGSTNLTVSGGSGTYSFIWSNGATTEDLINIGAGAYTVTVTDANACSVILNTTVNESAVLQAQLFTNDVNCFGNNDGEMSVTVSGGTPGYNYLWSNGITNTTVVGLSPGNYTLTITDANACTMVLSGSIAEPSQLNVTADTESVSCNTGDDGRITNVVVTGGTADYYYSWSDMAAEAIWSFEDSLYDVSGNAHHPNGIRGTIAFSTDAAEGDYSLDFNGIDAGVRYSFNGAFMESTFTERTVALYLKPNDLLTRQTIYDEGGAFYGLSIELFNGNIIVGVAKDPATITTHTTPFPNDGAWHHLAVVYNNGALSLYIDGGLISTVATGLGTIFSAGENGGIGQAFGNNAFGNSGGLHYNGLMDHVRLHNVALTANQLSDMITHDGTRNNLAAGTYTLIVSDENACTQTIDLTIGGAAVLTANLALTNISCFNGNNGAIDLIPSGGATPLSFVWSNGATTEDLNGITEGRYDVTVTDNNGCTLDTFAILTQPTALTLSATVTSDYNGEDVSCGGATDGNAVATAAGGAGSYLYAWQNGQIGPNLTNVGAGTYVVTVTDANSCSSVTSVTLTEPTAISLTAQVTSNYNGEDVSCAGAADAVLGATASGGNGSYSYLWTTTQTTSSISGVAAGTYTVTVTDDFGCSSSASVSVSEPSTVSTSIGITSDFNGFPVSCDSGADGDLNSTSSGGTGSYTYLWTTGATTSNITGLGAGTYILTVTDQNGCTAADTISLVAAGAINFTAIASDLTDCGVNNGQVSISAVGGTGSFEYRINGSAWQTDSLFSGLSPGTYDAYVRNIFGTCMSGPRTVVIDVPESPTINNIVRLNPTTGSSADGSLLVNATGNLTALEYRINIPGPGWTPWQSSTLFENLTVGVYDVEVKYNGQNCIAATQAELVAGGGISGNGGGVNYCSDEINGAQFVEAYYIPAPEDQILQSLRSIYSNNGPLFCGTTTREPSNPVSSYVGIGIVEDGVVIYFDHWEDGYEVNLSFPVQGSTEIWGDNNPANGIPPGFTVDILTAADQIVLNNDVVTTTRQSVIDYDGGDKVAALGNIAMTRLAWANQSSTLLAGALEVYPVTLWGTNYEIPVGENTDVNEMFEYTGAYIMAQNDGTTVNIDVDGNGSFETTTTLNQGQSYLINGNLNAGGEITASSNVQVHLVTGDECSTFESRFFTLKPTVQWSDSYYSPVSTQNDLSGASNDDNHPTYVHLYNPNSTSIRVFWETSGGTQPFIDINPGQTAWEDLPDGSAAHFYTTNGMDFYAVATVDSDPDGTWSNSAHDWGFALIPESQLSSQITLVGFAPGMDPDGNGLCCTGNTWSIQGFDSEDVGSGSLATNAIDGDETTLWHTDLSGTPGYPHFIEVDLGSTNSFTGFRYTPRQDGSTNGTIAGYELYYWDGGAYVFITSGTWASNTDAKEVYFPEVTSRYIRLVALSEINGNNWASAAELEVLNPENSSPVWVTADYPTGSTSTGPITLCIDYDGDNSGPGYDTQITLNPLEIVRLRDIVDNDNDQTGMRIWVCDGSDAIIAGAWGQDPANASGSSPAIDLGTGLPNGIPFAATKCVDISKDYNLNGLFDECDEIIYTIVIRNTGALSLSTGAVRITDTLSNNLTYVEGTTFTRTGGVSTLLADDTTPNSPFPLDEGGTNYNSVIAPGDSVIISFEAVINNVSAATFINNEASIFNANKELIPSVAFPVEDPELPALTGVPANATVSCDSVPNAPMINDVNCNLGSVNYPPNQSGNSTAMDGQTIATGTTNTTFSIVNGTIIRDFRIADFRYPRDASENLPCGASTRAIHFSQRERESNSEYGAGTTSTVRIDFSQAVENLSFSINDLDESLFHLDAVVVRIFDASNAELDYDCGYFTYGSKVEQVGNKEFQALDNSFGYEAVNNADADGDIRFAFYNLNIRRVEITYKNNWTVNSNASNFTQTNFDDYMNANNNSEQDIGIGQICYCIPGTNEGTVFVANDCANNTNIVYNETRTDGSCPYNYTLTRTWTATDHCGNTSTASQELTIQDIEAPVLSDYPVDLTVALDSVPPVPTITATDNCGIAVVSFAADTTTNICEITIRRTWTAVDECSNSVSHSQNILINAVINASTLVTSNYNGEDVSCNGASDGSAVVRFEGGQAPITFLWSTGSLDSTITNVPAGNYTVTVTDNNGCEASATVVLIEPSAIAVTANVTSDYNGQQISCSGGSDGTAFASAIGGTPPISFLWSTGQTTQNIISLSSGTYFVTATDSNGCEEVESVTLTNPPPFTTNPTVISNYNGAQVSCTGASDANISPGVMGGIGTLSFIWSNGANTPVLSNVNAGTYFVTVTDANGCTTVGSTTVSNPPPINLNLSVTSDYNGADISCTGESDGSATVVASGGVGGFTYEWNTGSVSTNLSGLNSNTYTVTVTDNNGCTAIGNITLDDPSPLIVDGSIVTDITCNGIADGTATAVATGGTGTISYSWSNGQNGANATGLAANTYIVTAEDANACTATDTLIISDPLPITLETSLGIDPSYCQAMDGTITVVATGGANDFEYRLNSSPWQTDTTFTGLSGGTYYIFVRNIDGTCEVNPDSIVLTDPIPSACPIITDTDPLVVCSSAINVPFSVAALFGADSYIWTTPDGTNVVSGQGTNSLVLDINGLAVGTYTICVETVSACGVSSPCCYNFEVITCSEICDNGIDDDGDGLTDCLDPDCEPIVDIIEPAPACINETVSFEATNVGAGAIYNWSFGANAVPTTATGIGPHDIVYINCGNKRITVAVELNGCMAYDTMFLNITDTELPTFTTPANITIDCDDAYTDLTVTGDVTDESDNCSINLEATYVDDLTQLTGCGNTGMVQRTWFLTDDCGNGTSAVQTITIRDTIPPTAINGIPADTTVDCDAIPSPPAIGTTITGSDDCDPAINISLNETNDQTNNGSCTDYNYTITRTWIAIDDCGNSSTAVQLIQVEDTEPPLPITGIPADVTVNCDAIPTPPNIGTDITTTDNCDPSVDIVLNETDTQTNDGSCSDNNYVITRVWNATDACGNAIAATQLITVIDTMPPTALTGVPGNILVSCDAIPAPPAIGSIGSSDNCDASLDISMVESSNQTNNQTCTDNNYVITRTWIAIDNCGNNTTALQIITVVDSESPVLSGIPADTIVNCDNIPVAPTTGTDITATDNCTAAANIGINLIETSSQTNNGSCNDDSYSILRLWVATDLCGNTATAQQIIQVVDNVAPTFTLPLPMDVTVSCDQLPTTIDTLAAIDNCVDSADVNILFVQTSDQTNNGTCSDNNYTITRTWTVVDRCGNNSTHQQVITVVDTISPYFTSIIPADTLVSCNGIPAAPTVTASDGCDSDSELVITLNETTNQTNTDNCTDNNYSINRTWTATDQCGNTVTAQQIITVFDSEAPTITIAARDTIVECDGAGNTGALNDWINRLAGAAATDNCDNTIDWNNDYDGLGVPTLSSCDTDTSGVLEVIFTATDNCGNNSSTTARFIIIDTNDPVITASVQDTIVECDGLGNLTDLNTWLNNNGGAIANDACNSGGGFTWTNDYNGAGVPGLPACDNDTTNTLVVVFTATDFCGNTVSQTANFTIIDATPPSLTPVNDITVDCDDIPAPVAPTAADDCDPSVDIVYQEVTVYHPSTNWKSTGSCSLVQTISAASYDDKGTASTSDDEMSFTLTVIGQNTGAMWSAMVNGVLISGSYYTTHEFGPILSNGSVLNFTIIDNADGGCTLPVELDIADF